MPERANARVRNPYPRKEQICAARAPRHFSRLWIPGSRLTPRPGMTNALPCPAPDNRGELELAPLVVEHPRLVFELQLLQLRSEEHTSELQSRGLISYAV